MTCTQTENALEKGFIKTLTDMAYEYVAIRNENDLLANFKKQLEKHNAKQLALHNRTELTESEFQKILLHLEGGTRFEKAKKLRELKEFYLDNGDRIWLEFLNTSKWCQNEFQVSNQIRVEGDKECRYDVTVLINGLPLVQIELKKRGMELKQAYNQVQRYHKTSYHGLFHYIQLFVISNGVNTRYFANNPNSGFKFTFNWTTKKNEPFNQLSKFAVEFFDRCTLGKILSKYMVLHEGDKCLMVLRPYQYYAVEEILDRVEKNHENGYIWHTTGAGKTLTSFKAAQLVSEMEGVEKVLFVVDRRDLDTQTQTEYEAFEPGAVDGTDNTRELIRRLSGNSKIIITTIQKLNCAVTKEYYNKYLQDVSKKRVVMIFDECHRSHFGECHKNIVHFFSNLQLFGFTGTPIFPENSKDNRTTKEVLGNCLHQYLIKDAIADDNVLGFLVEYYTGSVDLDVESEKRMEEIASFILNNFNKSTFEGEFNALFAVQSVPMLLKYYKIFKSMNPRIKIGAIFTYAANASQDDESTGMNQGFSNNKVEADELQEIMDDYNHYFGTAYTTDNFALYYDDINKRMKKKEKNVPTIDLLLVVGMFLTGFDAKKLNTLYVDKNLEYHSLLQAFSRTNRVLNEKKRFGKIVCFRDLKPNVDAAIKLFSNDDAPNFDIVLHKPYAEVKKDYLLLTEEFLTKYPTVDVIDFFQNEHDKVDFILAFRDIIKKHAEMQIYEEYHPDDISFIMSEQEFQDFRSKYLDIAQNFGAKPVAPTMAADLTETPYGDQRTLNDIDFCLELLHSDVVNVAYILSLMHDLDPESEDYAEKRKGILDTMIRDAEMRSKADLIDGFIRETVDLQKEAFRRQKADGTVDLEGRLRTYVNRVKAEAIAELAQEEQIDEAVLHSFISEYDYLHREKPEIIQNAIKQKKLGLKSRKNLFNRIMGKLRVIMDVYNWE